MKTNFLLLSFFLLMGWQTMAKPHPKRLPHTQYPKPQTFGLNKKAILRLPQTYIIHWWGANQWSSYADSIYYKYDSQGNLIEKTTKYNKTQNTFDTHGNITASLTLSWNNIAGMWVPSHKDTILYDANGNETFITSFDNNNGIWEIDYSNRYTNTYNNQNQLIQIIDEEWISDTTYGIYSQQLFTYTTQGGPTQVDFSIWNGLDFTPTSRFTDIQWFKWSGHWNESSLLSSNIYEWADSIFVQTFRESHVYDVYGNETLSSYEYWDGTVFTQTDGDKSILTYDLLGSMIERIGQRFNQDSGYYVNNAKETYEDFRVFSSVQNIAKNNQYVSLYPNPATSSITVELKEGEVSETISIYNLTGMKVLQATLISNQNQIDVSLLPKGLYIYKLQSGITGKLMIN